MYGGPHRWYYGTIILSNNFSKHLCHVDASLKACKQARIKLKVRKCQLGYKEVPFLEAIVGEQGIKPQPKTAKKVRTWMEPKDKDGVRKFLGLSGYRHFIKVFSTMVAPLNKLMRKVEFYWGNHGTRALQRPEGSFAFYTRPVSYGREQVMGVGL